MKAHYAANAHPCRGKKMPLHSARMKANNPTRMPGVIEKISKAMQGKTFLARGGNGQLTKPQMLLAQTIGLAADCMEHVISVPQKEMREAGFKSPPTHYKVDIWMPGTKVCVEVDGASHRTKLWKFLDRRKTEMLGHLGWSVIRFTNERILAEPGKVAAEVIAFTASR